MYNIYLVLYYLYVSLSFQMSISWLLPLDYELSNTFDTFQIIQYRTHGTPSGESDIRNRCRHGRRQSCPVKQPKTGYCRQPGIMYGGVYAQFTPRLSTSYYLFISEHTVRYLQDVSFSLSDTYFGQCPSPASNVVSCVTVLKC